MMELVEMEVRELLSNFGYDGDNSPVSSRLKLYPVLKFNFKT